MEDLLAPQRVGDADGWDGSDKPTRQEWPTCLCAEVLTVRGGQDLIYYQEFKMSEWGGKRDGAGRPLAAVSKVTREAVERARETGQLPHEFLLRITRGESIDGRTPTIQQRIDAAKAAAPYFAPRLTPTEVTPNTSGRFEDMSVEELDAYIADREALHKSLQEGYTTKQALVMTRVKRQTRSKKGRPQI